MQKEALAQVSKNLEKAKQAFVGVLQQRVSVLQQSLAVAKAQEKAEQSARNTPSKAPLANLVSQTKQSINAISTAADTRYS